MLAWVASGMIVGIKTAERTRRNWIGFVAGLAACAIFFLIFDGLHMTLRRAECRGQPYFEACVTGD
jgi:hypothetical protein